MKYPVVAADGNTYERAAIQRWMTEQGAVSLVHHWGSAAPCKPDIKPRAVQLYGPRTPAAAKPRGARALLGHVSSDMTYLILPVVHSSNYIVHTNIENAVTSTIRI